MPQVIDLTDYKLKYPQVASIPDEQLQKMLHKEFYPNIAYEDFIAIMGEKYGFHKHSFGVGGEYEKPSIISNLPQLPNILKMNREERKEFADEIAQGVIPPPLYDRDPKTDQLVERKDIKWYDPIRGVGKVIEGAGGFIPTIITYPEGVPKIIGEIIEGVGATTRQILQASPVTPFGTPNPFFKAESMRQVIADPAGHIVMSIGIPYGAGVGIASIPARLGAIRTALTTAEMPTVGDAVRAKLRARADQEMGRIEENRATTQVPAIEDKVAPPPENVPYSFTDPVQVFNRPNELARFETARKRYLNIVKDEHEILVRKSGEKQFKKLEKGKERLWELMETKQAPIERVILHKDGNVTLRLKYKDQTRIYKINKLDPEAPVKVVKVEPPKESVRALKGEALYFAPPEVMKMGEYWDNVKVQVNNILDHSVRAAESTLRTEPGKLLKREFSEAYEYSGTTYSTFMERAIRAGLNRLNTNEAVNLFDTLQKTAEPINSKVYDLSREMRKFFDEGFGLMQEAGLKVADLKPVTTKTGKLTFKRIWRDPRKVTNYVPRMVKSEISYKVFSNIREAIKFAKELKESEKLSDKRLGEIVQSWVENKNPLLNEYTLDALGAAIARGENAMTALRNIQRWMGYELFRPGSFEHARTMQFPDYFYERDMRVIFPRYFSSLSRRYGEAKVWGWKNKGLVNRIAEIAKINIKESDIARNIAEVFTGEAELSRKWSSEAITKFLDVMVDYEVWTKIYLGTAAIPNATQFSISTIPMMGLPRFVTAIGKLATDPKFREVTGEASAMHTMSRAVQIMGGYDPRMGWLRSKIDHYMQLHPFSVFNRMQSYLAAATGEVWIRDLYKIANRPKSIRRGFAIRKLRELEINPRLPLTDDIVKRKMFRVAVKTQLLRDILKDPVHASDPRFRAFFLFQRFGYKQFRFFKQEVLNELRCGNVFPLIRAATLGYLGGELVVYAKNRTRELVEGLTALAWQGDYEFIPRYRRDKVTDTKSFLVHALNNYAAIGTMGFFSDIFRINDPRQTEAAPDVVSFASRNLAFIATPVIIRELFINPTMEFDYFIKTWRNRGLTAAVDQLELGVLRNISPMSRYAAG